MTRNSIDFQCLFWSTEIGKGWSHSSDFPLLSFIVISIAIFIGDNIGKVINRLAIQESVIAEKEDTIQVQVSEIQHKDEQLEQSYQQQINIISSIQHELGNKLPIAKNTLSDLKSAFEKIPSFDLDQKIRQRLPGESEASIDSFSDLHRRLETNLFYAISIVDNIRGVLKAALTGLSSKNLEDDLIPLFTY